jgi:hypothetical protein
MLPQRYLSAGKLEIDLLVLVMIQYLVAEIDHAVVIIPTIGTIVQGRGTIAAREIAGIAHAPVHVYYVGMLWIGMLEPNIAIEDLCAHGYSF